MRAAEIEEAAVALAQQGLAVFPIRADRTPACRWGRDATAKPDNVRGFWWKDDSLIGVVTGTQSGISVLDIDIKDGKPGAKWLAANHRKLPRTRVQLTKSGGRHLLFRHVDGVCNSVGGIAAGVDVRGEGGMVIWWPAAGCEVLDGMPLHILPPWPDWLIPAPPPPRPPRRCIPDDHQLAALCDFVARSLEGERNSRLFWAACRMRELLYPGMLDAGKAEALLFTVARRVGLDERGALRTIRSGLGRA